MVRSPGRCRSNCDQKESDVAERAPRSKNQPPGSTVLVLPRKSSLQTKRPKTSKTRSGCRECKRRRVKCDETRPACRRCVLSNRMCDMSLGYAEDRITAHVSETPRWGMRTSRPPDTSPVQPLDDCRLLSAPNYVLSLFKNQGEWDNFSVFLTTTQQGGSLPINYLSALTPQIAHHDVAIREICCAVGAMDNALNKPFSRPDYRESQSRLSLMHYNRALRALSKAEPTGDSPLKVALASVLLVTYDIINGNIESSFVHFSHCCRIAESYFSQRVEKAGVPLPELSFDNFESALFDMLHRLSTHPWALELGISGSRNAYRVQRCFQGLEHRYDLHNMPAWFRDQEQAMKWWDVTQHFMVRRLGGVSQDSTPDQDFGQSAYVSDEGGWEECLVALQRWRHSFAPFFLSARRNKDQDAYAYIQACVLETLYLETFTGLYHHHPDRRESLVVPDVKPIYQDIVRSVKRLQPTQKELSGEGASEWPVDIFQPLVFVLFKCQDVEVRGEIRSFLESVDNSVFITASSIIDLMNLQQLEDVPQEWKNVERAMGWGLTSCGCSSGPVNVIWQHG